MSIAETYPLNVAAKAAGTNTKKLRSRLDHGSIKLRGSDRKSTGSGDWVGLSRNRILQIAIIETLTGIGVTLSAASTAALTFTDEGQASRSPGELFEHGKTVLVIAPDGTTVKNVFFDASLADVSKRAKCAITVDLNKVAELVDATLKKAN
jgi:hypothetical protein